ncbi:MAG: 2-dehydropantoate 2-reductase [Candidatus Thermoplasmatota archaeon]|nr:2-dehydropantoate 2-reductase [Candidatus Thermoplasmatota archaeon]
MNIVVMGSGAIGSLFGALLSTKHTVTLIGRHDHVHAIKTDGLRIHGKTEVVVRPSVAKSIKEVYPLIDLLLFTVKSYDTLIASRQLALHIDEQTPILSLQNGLGNVEKISRFIPQRQILAGVTTHGSIFPKPGTIYHTGFGDTTIGEIHGKTTGRVQQICDTFNEVGITTTISKNIVAALWEKSIINSSINPLTAFFQCKNGSLLQNPLLESIVERVCEESTAIAQTNGFPPSSQNMVQKTKQVICETAHNQSSMLQSIQKGKRTEIDAINGKLVEVGKKHHVETTLNELLLYLVKSRVPST